MFCDFLKMLQALRFCNLKTEMIIALDDMDSFYMHFKVKEKKKRKYLILRQMDDDSTHIFCNCSAENTYCMDFTF